MKQSCSFYYRIILLFLFFVFFLLFTIYFDDIRRQQPAFVFPTGLPVFPSAQWRHPLLQPNLHLHASSCTLLGYLPLCHTLRPFVWHFTWCTRGSSWRPLAAQVYWKAKKRPCLWVECWCNRFLQLFYPFCSWVGDVDHVWVNVLALRRFVLLGMGICLFLIFTFHDLAYNLLSY